MTVEERFWAKVDAGGSDDCWPWVGNRGQRGYGRFWYQGRMVPAHRMAWALDHGQMFPGDMDACHTCDNPPCCNPAHIFPGTKSENARDSINKGRFYFNRSGLPQQTTCKRGHLLEGSNLGLDRGNRFCRTCRNASKLRWYHSNRAAYASEPSAAGET